MRFITFSVGGAFLVAKAAFLRQLGENLGENRFQSNQHF